MLNRECFPGILKEGFCPYSSPLMLISQKMTQDKRGVMDFRHLNIRIGKNKLAYPLVRETFSALGISLRCKVLSVLDLKDAFHSLWLLVLCNPKFIYKNNWYFDLSSTYFLYPLASLPKMVKQEMPASIEQS